MKQILIKHLKNQNTSNDKIIVTNNQNNKKKDDNILSKITTQIIDNEIKEIDNFVKEKTSKSNSNLKKPSIDQQQLSSKTKNQKTTEIEDDDNIVDFNLDELDSLLTRKKSP